MTSARPQPIEVDNVSTNTTNDKSVAIQLQASSGASTLRIVAQPQHGSVGLTNGIATYFPDPGFVGSDTFFFAAYDGAKNSERATGTVAVAQGPYGVSATPHVPDSAPAGWSVTFRAAITLSNISATAECAWNFGDGTAPSTGQFVTHTFAVPGRFTWDLTVTIQGPSGPAQEKRSGQITVNGPLQLGVTVSGSSTVLSWPRLPGDVLLEWTPSLSGPLWQFDTNPVSSGAGSFSVTAPVTEPVRFYRLRQR